LNDHFRAQGNYAPIERSLRAKILEITGATLIISPQKKVEKCSFGFYIMNALLILFAHELTIHSQHREMFQRTMKNSTLYNQWVSNRTSKLIAGLQINKSK
jgi:hypothetical protein